MNEHEKQKRIELADGVGYAMDALISKAGAGGMISIGEAVRQLQAEFPDAEINPAEMAEAVVRKAAARGLAVLIGKDQPADAQSRTTPS